MSELSGSGADAPREVAGCIETVGVAKARMAALPLLMLGVLAGALVGLGRRQDHEWRGIAQLGAGVRKPGSSHFR